MPELEYAIAQTDLDRLAALGNSAALPEVAAGSAPPSDLDWRSNWATAGVSAEAMELAMLDSKRRQHRAPGVQQTILPLVTTALAIGILVGLWVGFAVAQ